MTNGGVELSSGKIICANSGDDTLTVIDRNFPYEKNIISLFDLKLINGNRTTDLIKNKMGPIDLAINKKGNLLVLNSLDDSIIEIDLASKIIIGIAKVGRFPVSFKLYNNSIYVVNCDSNSLTIIEEESLNVIENIYLGEKPTDIQIDKNNSKAYITNSNNYSISVLDIDEAKLETIKLDTQPIRIIIKEDLLFLLSYVNNGVENYSSVSAIDVVQHNLIWSFKIRGIYFDFLYVDKEMNFYLVNPDDGFLYCFNNLEGHAKKLINVGEMPNKIFMDDEKNIYISDLLKDQIVIVDGIDFKIIEKIRVGKEPQGILLL